MPTSRPTVRLAPAAQQWLDAYVAARPDWDEVEASGFPMAPTMPTASGRAQVVDVRSASTQRQPNSDDAHPGVPDLTMWQVIREVREVSTAPSLRTRTDIVAAVVDATGVAPTRVTAAIAYWAEHPDEVTAHLHS